MSAQLPLEMPVSPSYAPEDFIITDANGAAHGQLLAGVTGIGLQPASAVTLLTGPSGAGKTHLGHIWLQLNGGRLLQDGGDLSTLDRGAYLLVEDADAVPFTRKREEWFFHLANYAKEKGCRVLITALNPPAHWSLSLADWQSRALSFPLLTLTLPDDDTLIVVLSKLAADRQLAMEGGVVDYLVRRMDRSYHGASRVIAALDRASLAKKRRTVTIPVARTVLEELIQGCDSLSV